MDAKELRIGNYVYRLGELTEINAIELINKNSIGYVSTKISGAITLNQIKPIPLTEQWLKDFGFEYYMKRYRKKYTETDKEKFWISISKYLNKEIFYTDNIRIHKQEIQYIHQLQNLYFALTGKELIKNEIMQGPPFRVNKDEFVKPKKI